MPDSQSIHLISRFAGYVVTASAYHIITTVLYTVHKILLRGTLFCTRGFMLKKLPDYLTHIGLLKQTYYQLRETVPCGYIIVQTFHTSKIVQDATLLVANVALVIVTTT